MPLTTRTSCFPGGSGALNGVRPATAPSTYTEAVSGTLVMRTVGGGGGVGLGAGG